MSKRVLMPFVAILLALAGLAVLTGLASVTPDAAAAAQATLVPRAYIPFASKMLSDPLYAQQWALAKIDAPHAWALSQGTNVAVAVVDTGVDLTHPDLASKIVPNSGYNFVANNNNPQDDNGHGTHVAGIIGAATDNGAGVASIGWAARIVPVKVLDNNGIGYLSDIANGVNWAANSSARIINLSLGAPFPDNTLQTAITNAWNRGKLVVAAAGNCGDGSGDPPNYSLNGCFYLNQPSYPAAGANVIAVGSTTNADTRSSFSTSGSWVDISAPGSSILSTLWTTSPNDPLAPHSYAYESGTSMAAPMVSGLAALVWARNPGLNNSAVQDALQQSAVDLGAPGRDFQFGYGRINAYGALQLAATAAAQGTMTAQAAAVERPPVAPRPGAQARPGVVLVRMKPSAQAASAQAALQQRYNVQVAGEIGDLGVQELHVPAGSEYDTAVKLMADPAVEYAEPDYVVRALN